MSKSKWVSKPRKEKKHRPFYAAQILRERKSIVTTDERIN